MKNIYEKICLFVCMFVQECARYWPRNVQKFPVWTIRNTVCAKYKDNNLKVSMGGLRVCVSEGRGQCWWGQLQSGQNLSQKVSVWGAQGSATIFPAHLRVLVRWKTAVNQSCLIFVNRHVKGRVLVALADGTIAIFHRGIGKSVG